MIVVLDLDDDDVEAVVETLISALPRRPSRLDVLTEHTLEAHRVRRALGWLGPAALPGDPEMLGSD